MQDSTSFLFNVTSGLVSSASQGPGDYFTSVLTPTHSTIVSDHMSFVSSTDTSEQMTSLPSTITSKLMTYLSSAVTSEQMTSLPSKTAFTQMPSVPSTITSEQMASMSSTVTSEQMTSLSSTTTFTQMPSVPSTITSEQMTSKSSTVISEQMTSLPSTTTFTQMTYMPSSSEPMTSLPGILTSAQMTSVPNKITSEQMTFVPSSVTFEQITFVPSTVTSTQITPTPSTIVSEQMTSPAFVISNEQSSSGSLVATQSISSPSHNSSQVTPYTELVTSPTSQPSTPLMPSVVNATVISSTPSSISFQIKPTSMASSNSSVLQTSSTSAFHTSFLEPTTSSNITSTEYGSYPSEIMTQPLTTSMMQTETYVSESVTNSFSDLNSTLSLDFLTLNISSVFPTTTEVYSSVNDTDTFNTDNSTIELSQISPTLVESMSFLESPYNESASTYYLDINATESMYYESTTTDFWNVTENTTDATDVWNTTEADTTTLNTTILTTLKTTMKTSTVTTTAKTTTKATTVSSTTQKPIEVYSLTAPAIIGITVGLVVLTALIFVMLLWRRKVKQDHSVNVPKRYSVNSTKSRSFKHSSLYGGRSGEHHHPHFAPVYYGETDQVNEEKPVRMSSYKIKDTNTKVGQTFDEVDLRSKEPISHFKKDSTKVRHSFPYEKRHLHFYSQYGKGPNNIEHSLTLKEITNGNVNKNSVNGTSKVDKPENIQINGTGVGDKPEYIKMNGVNDSHSKDNGYTKPQIEITKL